MKKIITNSKARIAGAAVAAAILAVLSVLAVKGDGMVGWKLALALGLSFLAGASILVKGRFGTFFSIWLMFLLPAGTLCCVEFYTHVPQDLTTPIFLLNYLFYLLLFLAGTAIFGSSAIGSVFGTAVPMIFGLVNYYVVSFRSSPIVPWDLYSIGTAASIMDNYELEVSWRLLFVLMGFAGLLILGTRTSLKFQKKRWKARLASVVLSVGLLLGYVGAVKTEKVGDLVGLDDILFTPNVLYRNNGLMGAFLSNLKYMDVEKPEGYSVKKAEAIAGTSETEGTGTEQTAQVSEETPNIIVIMNEAFSDLSVYGDFETSEEYMPFINSLTENTEKGWLYVSVKGGNTANSEFEFLTGNSMAFLPAGSVPYQQYIKSEMPSLASQLAALGYETNALHPYRAAGWCRDKVYPWLGFENTYFQSDFTEATKLRGYIDDVSAFQKLIELYETKEEGVPQFSFEVTMQNHGGYSKEYEDLDAEVKVSAFEGKESTQTKSVEKYLTLIKKSDEAFQMLVEYFEQQEEPTIILMFGDHQPSDYITSPIIRLNGQDPTKMEESTEEYRKTFEVPYVMWANYEIDTEEEISLSANYLSARLLEKTGIPLSGYQSWLSELRETYPVITGKFYAAQDEEGNLSFHDWEELSADSAINDYGILQYNNISDWKHRLTNFFE